MPHFLIKSNDVKNASVTLVEPELLAHFSVMRVRAGEELKLIDENKNVYYCTVETFSKRELVARVINEAPSKRFLPFKITLVQGILKPDAQTLAVANAAQMGVSEFLPVIMDNSTVNFNSVREKQEKWQKIADEAFKQCERADLMDVLPPVVSLEEALENKQNVVVFAERNASATLEGIKGDVTAVIGPEGGFSKSEFEFFARQKYPLVSIGNLILKAPNAVVAGLAQIIYEKNNG